jgi:Uma2 family endonuclease
METAAQLEPITGIRLSGEIVAENISYEDFLHDDYGEGHFEWYNGYVIKMPGIEERHDALTAFFRTLLSLYLEQTGGGRVAQDPMIMRPRTDLPARAPDIQVLLPEHVHYLQHNQVIGAADLVIEIVSPGSERRDRIEKFREYELAGVGEYWIVDHKFREALFHQQGITGEYERIEPDENGVYHSKVLERLSLPIAILWQETLPGVLEIVRMVEAMLTKK